MLANKHQVISTLLRRGRPDLANVIAYQVVADYDVDSVGLFIKAPPAIARQRPSLGDDDTSPPHCTVLFIGKCDDRQKLLDVVRPILAATRPFVVGLAPTVSYFEPTENSGDRRVAKLEVWDDKRSPLYRLRGRLWDAFEREGVPFSDSFSDYSPHMTLGYIEPGTEYDGPIPQGQWWVRGLDLWGFERDQVLPFGKEPV
jgi:2'-5' RNA ligase